MYKVPERDWKVVKKLHPIMLQRYCQRVLQDVQDLTPEGEGCDYHTVYLKLYKLVRERDKAMRDLFDDLSRNNAIIMIMMWINYELITDEELAMFSEETLAVVNFRV